MGFRVRDSFFVAPGPNRTALVEVSGVAGGNGAPLGVDPIGGEELVVRVRDEPGAIIPAAVQPVDRHAVGVPNLGVRSRVDRSGADHRLELRRGPPNDPVVVFPCCFLLD